MARFERSTAAAAPGPSGGGSRPGAASRERARWWNVRLGLGSTGDPGGDRSWVLTLGLSLSVILTLIAVLYLRSEPVQSLKIATGEWQPYTSQNRLEEYGVASAVVTAVMREIGYEPHLVFEPWDQAWEDADKGETDDGIRGTFPWTHTPERDKRFHFSPPILRVEFTVFYNADRTPQVEQAGTMQDLQNLHLLRIEGYEFPDDLRPEVERLSRGLPPVATNLEAFRRLIEDPRVQLVAEATEAGNQLIRQHFAAHQEQIRASDVKWFRDVYLLASRRNPDNRYLMDRFRSALETLKADGRYEALVDRMRLKFDEQRVVVLQPVEPHGHLLAFDRRDRSRTVVLPSGTHAVVEAWGIEYLQLGPAAGPLAPTLIRVRLLDGPLRSQSLYVDSRAIHLP